MYFSQPEHVFHNQNPDETGSFYYREKRQKIALEDFRS